MNEADFKAVKKAIDQLIEQRGGGAAFVLFLGTDLLQAFLERDLLERVNENPPEYHYRHKAVYLGDDLAPEDFVSAEPSAPDEP